MGLGMCFLLAFCYVCLVCTERSELPQEILQKLAYADIRSISDLQRLLEINTVEDAPSPRRPRSLNVLGGASVNRSHAHRMPRSIAEEAPPSLCKARPVTFEIPRWQVDATSANFLVWPPCVELRRCTGCCNTQNIRCQPSRVRHKHFKVAKIEFVKRRPLLKKAHVKLEEHLECKCGCIPGLRECRGSYGSSSQHCQERGCGTGVR
uniref:Platelet-derived growth factor subunit A n=1 Tax=Eptatretus burgeri TaxID=7764 RepID=A0A8C4WS26_EPTBU